MSVWRPVIYLEVFHDSPGPLPFLLKFLTHSYLTNWKWMNYAPGKPLLNKQELSLLFVALFPFYVS
jgi:hypothetical protein